MLLIYNDSAKDIEFQSCILGVPVCIFYWHVSNFLVCFRKPKEPCSQKTHICIIWNMVSWIVASLQRIQVCSWWLSVSRNEKKKEWLRVGKNILLWVFSVEVTFLDYNSAQTIISYTRNNNWFLFRFVYILGKVLRCLNKNLQAIIRIFNNNIFILI